MKTTRLNLMSALFIATLTACSGSSTQYVDYTAVNNAPKLDMRAAIYQAVLPSGNTLTITTDQPNSTDVYGAYTIKNGSTIISSGKVSNTVSNLALTGNPGSPCPSEAISIVPISSSINAARDAGNISIAGISCSESSLPTDKPASKIIPQTAARMLSNGVINATQDVSISVASGDNVNFVGSVLLNDRSLPASATGTIIGTITSSSTIPSTINSVVEINDSTAFGFVFTRATNFSGHFLALNDSISALSGYVRTSLSPLPGQYYINEIGISVTNNGVVTQLGPVAVPFAASPAMLSYTPQ
jgi:hypothetical protein